jgi:DNA-binding winged helix-turn-helix (wHTH) protein
MELDLISGYDRAGFTLAESTVRPKLNVIQRNDSVYTVERQVMLVLLFLVERAGDVVPREEILTALWPDSFSNDEALTQVVSKLRRSLGDSPKNSHAIQTIHKVGYRLIVPVKSLIPVSDPEQHEAARLKDGLSPDSNIPPRVRKTRRNWSWVAIAIIGLVTSINAIALLGRDPIEPERIMKIRAIVPGVDTTEVHVTSLDDLDLDIDAWQSTSSKQILNLPASELDPADLETLVRLLEQGD